jgi:hypothetical protein
MQEQNYSSSDMPQLRCEECKRILGLDLAECSDRLNERCPYRVKLHNPWLNFAKISGISLIALTMLALSLLSAAVGSAIIMLVTGAIGIVVALRIFRVKKEFAVVNPRTGVYWQQTTSQVTNRLIAFSESTGLQPLDLKLLSFPSLSYPASIVMLPQKNTQNTIDAVLIVKSAMLSLMAQNVITLQYIDVYEERPNRPIRVTREYRFFAGQNTNQRINGELEAKVMLAVTHPRKHLKSPFNSPLLPGISIYLMIYGLFVEDESDPDSWLLSLPMGEALRRDLGTKQGHLFQVKRFAPYDSNARKFQQDRELILAWFQEHLPGDFEDVFDSVSARAIKARTKVSDMSPD